MGIQLFVPTFDIDRCLEEVRECLEKGWTGLGYKTVAFEEKWKAYTGHAHAHFLNSATVGLHLAIKAFKLQQGWADGDEVISTSMTFVSTNHAIAYENLTVRFADVDDSLCLDPDSVRERITDKTRAVLFVGHGGNTGRYADIVKLCKEKGLVLILDAAHMAGTRLNGRTPGLDADCTVYSYQAVKNLPTADAGMICFADAELDALTRKLTWLGINKDTYARSGEKGNYKWKYDVEYLGYKYHGNSIMAGIALVQLDRLDEDNAARRAICAQYDAIFAGHGNVVRPISVAPGCESSRHLYVIEVDRRDELMQYLNEHEIYPGVHYRDNTEYAMYAADKAVCVNARRLSDRILSLPLHLRLSTEDVELVCKTVLAFFQEAKA